MEAGKSVFVPLVSGEVDAFNGYPDSSIESDNATVARFDAVDGVIGWSILWSDNAARLAACIRQP